MRYPSCLIDSLKNLSEIYDWDDDDKNEIRDAIKSNPELVNYFIILSKSHEEKKPLFLTMFYEEFKRFCISKNLQIPFPKNDDYEITLSFWKL